MRPTGLLGIPDIDALKDVAETAIALQNHFIPYVLVNFNAFSYVKGIATIAHRNKLNACSQS